VFMGMWLYGGRGGEQICGGEGGGMTREVAMVVAVMENLRHKADKGKCNTRSPKH
jgi:hypothetical protein